MHEEHKKIIIKAIQDGFDFKNRVYDHAIQVNHDLSLKQVDFFLQLSSISVAILGAAYFFSERSPDIFFVILAAVFNVLNILWITSYTRSYIDNIDKSIKNYSEEMNKKMDFTINKAVESIQKNESKIFFDYAKEETQKKYSSDRLIYAGEIFTFIFINSIIFTIFANIKNYINISYNYDYILLVIFSMIISSLLSFTNFSSNIIESISRKI